MVNVLSGKDRIPEWEAKVVMATVTKAKTLKSNKAHIVHIARGKHCDAEIFFWLVAAWVKSRAERPSVSVVNRQLHVQIGCKLGIRNRKDELEASKAKQITN